MIARLQAYRRVPGVIVGEGWVPGSVWRGRVVGSAYPG